MDRSPSHRIGSREEQLDLFRHSDETLAVAFRQAAESARINPFETPEQSERRARYYEQQAQQHAERARRRP